MPAQLLVNHVDIKGIFADEQVFERQDGLFGSESRETRSAGIALAAADEAVRGAVEGS